jgi:fused signal recognition particle receptor
MSLSVRPTHSGHPARTLAESALARGTNMSEEKAGFFGRLKNRLSKSRNSLVDGVRKAFTGRSKAEDVFEALEEALIAGDIGIQTTMAIVNDLRQHARGEALESPESVLKVLKQNLIAILEPGNHAIDFDPAAKPCVILVAGVNGSGKTTTIGKLAARYSREGKSVMMAAGDTFRAAAADQLGIWSERTGVPIIRHQEGADPAAVAYDAAEAALARKIDCLIVDTAGRLHTKVNLMEELKKMQRVVGKRIPGAPHEVLLVLDATTGQNGLQQAKIFTEALNVTGIVLTKLDGTARGGIAVAIQKELGLPIKFIGVGETVDDLQPFDPHSFVDALLTTEEVEA